MVATLKVEASLASVISQPAATQPTTSIKKYKMLGRFLRLILPRFLGALYEDVFELLIVLKDRLYTLGKV